MTVEYRERINGHSDAVMTSCTFCGDSLTEQQNFAQHWRHDCSANPDTGSDR